MSEQTRNVFDLEEQKALDVIAVIRIITPVISIIREWGKVEREFSGNSTIEDKLGNNVRALEKVINIVSDESAKITIGKELSKMKNDYRKIAARKKHLSVMCSKYEEEAMNYLKYVWLFKEHISDSVMGKVIQITAFEEKDEILSLLFLLHNTNAINEKINKDFFNKECFKSFMDITGPNDWGSMLKQLKDNKI